MWMIFDTMANTFQKINSDRGSSTLNLLSRNLCFDSQRCFLEMWHTEVHLIRNMLMLYMKQNVFATEFSCTSCRQCRFSVLLEVVQFLGNMGEM